MSFRFSRLRRAAVLLGCALVLPAATAQVAGGKSITIVVPFPPGAGPDMAARTIAEKLAPRLGQAVVVDNKPGVGGLAGATFVRVHPRTAARCCWRPTRW